MKCGRGILFYANGSNTTQYWGDGKLFNVQNYKLASNIQMNELLNQGFQTVYDQLYSHK